MTNLLYLKDTAKILQHSFFEPLNGHSAFGLCVSLTDRALNLENFQARMQSCHKTFQSTFQFCGEIVVKISSLPLDSSVVFARITNLRSYLQLDSCRQLL
jgi:hypothetical protein